MSKPILCIGLLAAFIAGLSATGWSQQRPVVIYTKDNAPAAPKLEDLPLKNSLSQYGMTWAFAQPAHVGQFVNGDWYVVGPVTVVAIDPKPLYGAEVPAKELDPTDKRQPPADYVRNGFMVNPPPEGTSAYDSGTKNYFDRALIQKLPASMKPGDVLVTTISMPMGLVIHPPLCSSDELETRAEGDASPIKDAAILTCVPAPLPPDAFRPAFCDHAQRIYLARDLKRELLPTVAAPSDTPKIEQYIAWTQRPWVETGFFGFDNPADNMPWYGREQGRVTGNAALLLCANFTPQQKEPLLDNFVQIGIDYGGLLRHGYPGWEAFGGHGNGRKIPIVFAGLLLGDEELANVNKSFPRTHFGEDEQTAYGDSWTGAKVVFTGHRAIDEATGIARAGSGPYEQKNPSTWNGLGAGAARNGDKMSESYRRCCTSITWISQALVMHLMHAEKNWDHPAFFDYCDRWMYEDEAPILKAAGIPPPADYAREGQTWDRFVNEMWAKYRTAPGMPPTDGWKQPHDDGYLKNAIAQARAAGRRGN